LDWDLMRRLDVVDAAIPLSAGGPLRWAAEYGLLGDNGAARQIPVVLAHVNYADDSEIQLLQRSNASVVYCPRTRHFFGHDERSKHPYQQMLAAPGGGVNVCLGTDSLASNPDLNVLNEAKLLVTRDPIAAKTAIEMITWRGAEALGINAGRLLPGALADFNVFPMSPIPPTETLETLLARLLHESLHPTATWIHAHRIT
jgi:cytosine/adenosine deaminase-related metal-dependent hydrolase